MRPGSSMASRRPPARHMVPTWPVAGLSWSCVVLILLCDIHFFAFACRTNMSLQLSSRSRRVCRKRQNALRRTLHRTQPIRTTSCNKGPAGPFLDYCVNLPCSILSGWGAPPCWPVWLGINTGIERGARKGYVITVNYSIIYGSLGGSLGDGIGVGVGLSGWATCVGAWGSGSWE